MSFPQSLPKKSIIDIFVRARSETRTEAYAEFVQHLRQINFIPAGCLTPVLPPSAHGTNSEIEASVNNEISEMLLRESTGNMNVGAVDSVNGSSLIDGSNESGGGSKESE